MAEFLDGYRPQTPRYDRLKAALADYRKIARAGGWKAIPEGPTLKPGMTDPRVGLLRDRLRLWGGGTRKVSRILIDNKVPRHHRLRVPLLVAEDQILWVAGLRRSNAAPVRSSTKRILSVQLLSQI